MRKEDVDAVADMVSDPVDWDAADDAPDVDLTATDDLDTDTPLFPTDAPDDDAPEFIYDDGPVDTVVLPDEEAPVAPAPTRDDAQEPWGDSPETFDFRSIKDLNDRQAAFVRFAQQHPDLATNRAMLYEGFQTKAQEAATANRQLQDLEKQVAELKGRLDERQHMPDEEADSLDESTQQLYGWAERFATKHGRNPSYAELASYAAQAKLEPVLAKITELEGEREATKQRALAEQERIVHEEWAEVLATYPNFGTPEAEAEVVAVLGGIIAKRGGAVAKGDVKNAVRIAFGEELAATREAQARQAVATRATAVPSVQPGGTGRAPEAGPKTTSLDDVFAHQRKRGIAGLLQDARNRMSR
jgi:hypothetical protein